MKMGLFTMENFAIIFVREEESRSGKMAVFMKVIGRTTLHGAKVA